MGRAPASRQQFQLRSLGIVFWKGLPFARIPEAIASALAQPIDIPPAEPEPEAPSPLVMQQQLPLGAG